MSGGRGAVCAYVLCVHVLLEIEPWPLAWQALSYSHSLFLLLF